MFRAIGFIVRITLFSLFVLLLGNVVRWHGQTVSDQLRTHLAGVQRSNAADSVRSWVGDLSSDVNRGAHHKPMIAPGAGSAPGPNDRGQIKGSERQKLRALIRDLGGHS